MNEVRLMMRLNTVIGVLMLLPLILSGLPFISSIPFISIDSTSAKLLWGLIAWTVSMSWVIRFRNESRLFLTAPILILVAGLVSTVFVITAALGAGIFSVFLACSLPYLYSGFILERARRLLEHPKMEGNVEL